MRRSCSMVGIALVCAVSLHVGAQRTSLSPMFGIHGGLSYTTITGGDGESGISYRPGWAIGVYLEQPIADHWTFQPEVQYITKGVKFSDASGSTNATGNIKISYVEIPFFLRLNGTPSPSGFTPFAQLGPQVSFKTGCSISFSGFGLNESGGCGSDQDMSSVDFGVIGGLGADIKINGYPFSAVVRYDLGLKNISTSGEDSKNRGFTFLVGFRW